MCDVLRAMCLLFVSATRDRHQLELAIAKQGGTLVYDASPLVREELVLMMAALCEAQKAHSMG